MSLMEKLPRKPYLLETVYGFSSSIVIRTGLNVLNDFQPIIMLENSNSFLTLNLDEWMNLQGLYHVICEFVYELTELNEVEFNALSVSLGENYIVKFSVENGSDRFVIIKSVNNNFRFKMDKSYVHMLMKCDTLIQTGLDVLKSCDFKNFYCYYLHSVMLHFKDKTLKQKLKECCPVSIILKGLFELVEFYPNEILKDIRLATLYSVSRTK